MIAFFYQIELRQCKEDVENKSLLIKEAIQAIDDSEKKIIHLEDQCEDLVKKQDDIETGNKTDILF